MSRNRTATLAIAALGMVVLILDTKTAFNAAGQGIDICLKAVIPSLFPFFFLSAIINDRLLGVNLRILKPITRLCKIPEGGESLLLLGLIGGYPVGAASIHEAYRNGTLTKAQATRMLTFCNNAGPAFLFGMLAPFFRSSAAVWTLWLIHILSAVIVGAATPDPDRDRIVLSHQATLTPARAMRISIANMGCVCGWIILFRIILGFCERWFLWLLPQTIQILISGFFELSNGCLSLSDISCTGLRFLYAALFLSFGGICVGMQTASVVGDLPIKSYFLGKISQTAVTFVLAGVTQVFLFPNDFVDLKLPLLMIMFLLLFLPFLKKAVAFPRNMRYNIEN